MMTYLKNRTLLIIFVLLLITLTACGGGTKTLQKIVHEKAGDKIVSVRIMSGNTGEIKTYTEEAQISKIMEYFGEVSCTKSSPAASTGWVYSFEMTGSDGTVVKVTFAGANSSIDYEKYSFTYPDLGQFMEELDSIAGE